MALTNVFAYGVPAYLAGLLFVVTILWIVMRVQHFRTRSQRMKAALKNLVCCEGLEASNLPPSSLLAVHGKLVSRRNVRDELVGVDFEAPAVWRVVDKLFEIKKGEYSTKTELQWETISNDAKQALVCDKFFGEASLDDAKFDSEFLRFFPKFSYDNDANLATAREALPQFKVIKDSGIWSNGVKRVYLSEAPLELVVHDVIKEHTPWHDSFQGCLRIRYVWCPTDLCPDITLVGRWDGECLYLNERLFCSVFTGNPDAQEILAANIKSARRNVIDEIVCAIIIMLVILFAFWYMSY